MFPMKYFEYISSGLPVVSTPLDFMANGRYAVIMAGNDESFVSAIKHHLKSGKISKDKAEVIVGENTWACRIDKMIKCIENLESR